MIARKGPQKYTHIGCWREEYDISTGCYGHLQQPESLSCRCAVHVAYEMSYAHWQLMEDHLYKHYHVYQDTFLSSNLSWTGSALVAITGEVVGRKDSKKLINLKNPKNAKNARFAIWLGVATLAGFTFEYAAPYYVETLGIYQGEMIDYRQTLERIGGGKQKVQEHFINKWPCSLVDKMETKDQVMKKLSDEIMRWQNVGFIAPPAGEYISEEDFINIFGHGHF